MADSNTRTRPSKFKHQLARLTHYQASQLLGENAADLMRLGGQSFEVDPETDVHLGGDLFRVRFHDPDVPGGKAVALITQMSARRKSLHLRCDQCEEICIHLGAAVDFLMNNKLILGLAAPPDESVPLEQLTETELFDRALAERQKRADEEKMTVRATDNDSPWTDYMVTSHVSGKSYRVALRGQEPGESYCSCPDFRTNHLGTCKHILNTQRKVRQRFKADDFAKPYDRKNLSLRMEYGEDRGLRFNVPTKPKPEVVEKLGLFADHTVQDAQQAMKIVRALNNSGNDVHIYPDAEDFIESALLQKRLLVKANELRVDPAMHPLRKELLNAELLPYQLDGIAFAVGAGRAILADDMGLGKTIQGIGVSELLAQWAGIKRVLIVCPASLKSQWRNEIDRFSDRSAQLILGRSEERVAQYQGDAFFTICNYEQVLRDLTAIESANWDLIILDEGQRIKNWESKTSQVIRCLHSRFALVLSGTPLENRLDELFTVTQFVDDNRLGPAYRFFHRHRVVNDKGRVAGYQHLNEVREKLQPILLRRTRDTVMKQLPERSTEIVRIIPTEEQLEVHAGHARIVQQVINKPYISEMDLLRLQKALLMCRMVADSTFLIDKQEPEYSSKIDRLAELFESLGAEEDRKIIVFSEWRTMLDRIERILDPLGLKHVRLDGQVPQKKRPAIVREFQEDEECRIILMTNAGSTGLNLQSANTVVNVDLPWNPAILEQRIARAHRMGQERPVQVYVMVSEGTIEERLLNTLSAKADLAMAALDIDSDVNEVELQSGMEELKRRLEQLLGPTPEAPIDESQLRRVESETIAIAERRERVAAAGGQMLGAALQLVGELIQTSGKQPDETTVVQLRNSLSEQVSRDSQGRPELKLTLPNDQALTDLATTLAKLLIPLSIDEK